jgi:cytochrome c biogenesis protein CcmG/thiol:disulfide interchange protein DsbE
MFPWKSRSVFAGTIAAGVLLVLGCSTSMSVRAASIKPVKDRKPAPDFTLRDSMGKSVKLSDYRGKVVLLNFWATWCGPCKIEIPWFVEFEQKHKDSGFAVLGVSMDEEGLEVVRPYLEHTKVNYRILLGTDSVAQLYGGVDSLPTSFLLDREGRIAAVHVGLVSKGSYQDDINQLLGVKTSRAGTSVPAVPAVMLGAK